MVHQLGSECRHGLFHLRLVAKVDAVDVRRRVHVFDPAGAEVVQYGDLMTRREVRIHDVRTDEPGSPTHENSHGLDCNGFTC